jgi:hypothetical protein
MGHLQFPPAQSLQAWAAPLAWPAMRGPGRAYSETGPPGPPGLRCVCAAVATVTVREPSVVRATETLVHQNINRVGRVKIDSDASDYRAHNLLNCAAAVWRLVRLKT